MNAPDRIDLLFKHVKKPDGDEYSYREIGKMAGELVSSTAIWKARTGRTVKPGSKMIRALCTAFEVHPSFFSDEHVTTEDIEDYRSQYRSEKLLNEIALRASDLDNESKQAILNMIKFVARRVGGQATDHNEQNNQETHAGVARQPRL